MLPLALTVQVAREVLSAAGFDANLVALAAERPGEGIAKSLAVRPEIRIIDYTGSTTFGDWLEANARQAQVYTEKAGVNTVVVDSTDNYKGMLSNLAFSLSLYSGQMCTTPQNLLIPADGITTDAGHKTYDEVVADLAAAVEGSSATTPGRTRCWARWSTLMYGTASKRLRVWAKWPSHHGRSPTPTSRTPWSVRPRSSSWTARGSTGTRRAPTRPTSPSASGRSRSRWPSNRPGPLDLLRHTIRDKGAMTVGAYTTSTEVEQAVEEVCLEECAQLSLNLTGGVYVNQTAAFSDFHGSGGNPAANAALCDGAFVANRFRMVEVRRQA